MQGLTNVPAGTRLATYGEGGGGGDFDGFALFNFQPFTDTSLKLCLTLITVEFF